MLSRRLPTADAGGRGCGATPDRDDDPEDDSRGGDVASGCGSTGGASSSGGDVVSGCGSTGGASSSGGGLSASKGRGRGCGAYPRECGGELRDIAAVAARNSIAPENNPPPDFAKVAPEDIPPLPQEFCGSSVSLIVAVEDEMLHSDVLVELYEASWSSIRIYRGIPSYEYPCQEVEYAKEPWCDPTTIKKLVLHIDWSHAMADRGESELLGFPVGDAEPIVRYWVVKLRFRKRMGALGLHWMRIVVLMVDRPVVSSTTWTAFAGELLQDRVVFVVLDVRADDVDLDAELVALQAALEGWGIGYRVMWKRSIAVLVLCQAHATD